MTKLNKYEVSFNRPRLGRWKVLVIAQTPTEAKKIFKEKYGVKDASKISAKKKSGFSR